VARHIGFFRKKESWQIVCKRKRPARVTAEVNAATVKAGDPCFRFAGHYCQ
jgi:hypothetical protein